MSDQPTAETDNDTQCELAAWELLKEAREELAEYKAHAEKVRETISKALLNSVDERDKLLDLARELRDVLQKLCDTPHNCESGYSCEEVDLWMGARDLLDKAREVLP